ncbi:MAG: RNA polymerase subunit sigma-70 [Magnetospirillum sp.]|nr:RNA polymerase subunit sigma-70 [Magnetospirillum sp.]
MTVAVANDNHLLPFTALRPRLRGLAYRLLGSLTDADDVVQDAWLRWSAIDAQAVRVPEAFLTTLVSRLALDRLRAVRRARDAYVGQWLPEPAVLDEAEIDLPGEMSLAFLHLLERLTPDQRAVYVLREAMDLDYAEIAGILGKTITGCRQMMRRAREAVAGPARFAAPSADLAALADSFARASLARDYAAIVALLEEDAVLISDGGGRVRSALNPIFGADRIARFLIGIQRKMAGPLSLEPVVVNGGPGFLTRVGGQAPRCALLPRRRGRPPPGIPDHQPRQAPPPGRCLIHGG